MYFLSGGSFKMVKNRKKRVNHGHSEVIFEWTEPSLDLKICKEIRKSQGFFPFFICISTFFTKK